MSFFKNIPEVQVLICLVLDLEKSGINMCGERMQSLLRRTQYLGYKTALEVYREKGDSQEIKKYIRIRHEGNLGNQVDN